MNCIDAVEGTAKQIISGLHGTLSAVTEDDTEFVRSVRIVVDSADRFIEDHPDIFAEPDVLRNVLVDFARQLWVERMDAIRAEQPPGETAPAENDYDQYFFDHLFANGFPPR